MYCKQCGNELKDGAMFCTSCGAQQNGAPMATAPVVEPDLEKTVGVFNTIPNMQPEQPTVTPVQPIVEEQKVAPGQQQYAQPQNAYNPNVGEPHNGKVGFGTAVKLFFKNYVNFSGRASKSEYWWVFLFNIIMFIPLSLISTAIPPLGGLCSVALMIPGLSLAVRRLHDVGKSGAWWFMGLIPIAGSIILLIQFLKDSEGDNQWGPGPAVASYGANQFVNPSVNVAPTQKVVTDNDIYVMAQNHAPVNLNTPDAKHYMDSALGKIVPTYTGIENLAGAMMLCDPQTIKNNIAATDTDTLLVIFKALGYYIGQGGDASVLGIVQQNVLATLKTRF